MTRLQAVFAAGALALAATATAAGPHGSAAAAGGAAGSAAIGTGAGPSAVQSQGRTALAGREGFGDAQPGELGLLEYTKPRPRLSEWRLEKLRAFRTEALQREAQDGGTLSDSDRLYLRARLSRILVP